MSARALLERLEGQGVTVTANGGSLDLAYTEEPSETLRAEIAANKPDLLRLLIPASFMLAEEGCPTNPELAALVDKVGRCQQWLAERAHELTDDEWTRRRDMLLENLNRMDAELLKSGHCLEQFGWRVNENGRWGRTTEPDNPPQPSAMDTLVSQTYREIGEAFPSGALAWAEQQGPEMLARVDALVREWEAAYQRGDDVALSTALTSLLATCQGIAAAKRSPLAVAQPALIEWESRPTAIRA